MYCCSYGTAYTKETTAYDCALIPGASKTGGTSINAGNYGFCGGELAATNSATATTTVCCEFPILLNFKKYFKLSDHWYCSS